MNSVVRELNDRLFAFRKNINRMLAAEDAYIEYMASRGSVQAVKVKSDVPSKPVGSPAGNTYGDDQARIQKLYRRMVQAEENVADIERLLVGLDPDDVEFLEDMYWYRIPARVMAEERHVELRTIYHQRDRILREMAEKGKKV